MVIVSVVAIMVAAVVMLELPRNGSYHHAALKSGTYCLYSPYRKYVVYAEHDITSYPVLKHVEVEF